ncbi:rhomboid family intramembrane serine protease [Natronobacterium gregoryi]|uniref:Membrane protein n=2 Tax=Natronobacterium gregoryi TaxID=44930 RepID=L0AKH0_NATGS|nr:rhomboid family intramembrane serine protease [Natronobacterium gregoryi]AFZ74296.1 putative membrane protein [Natronobacterium gregoryi SP2]ELY63756.1 rhomboid family protein [Natronobacterium gregoryi SP2]PLK22194.1 rhomboid family intramembrane serine protease [Natronobacterium gregoryi SP2]SFI53189.1 Membrane associated serine protease, rhomboid family [Natronobacterium gregoryi]
MSRTLQRSRVTVLFLVIVWLFYGLRLGVESIYGEEFVLSLFVVRFSHLEYVWTWVTAPLGHGNFAHLLFNSMLALYLIPPVERALGPAKTSVAYIVGGALCAVIGTVLVVLVRVPFLSDATATGGLGSSIGLFVLWGLSLRHYWSHRNPPLAESGIIVKNSTLFGILLVISLGGIAFDIWRKSAGVPFPGLGHHYHAVGLVLGAMMSEVALFD